MVRVGHSEDVTVQDIGEMLRAMPGVLTVGQVSHNGDNNTAIMKVKLLTRKIKKYENNIKCIYYFLVLRE